MAIVNNISWYETPPILPSPSILALLTLRFTTIWYGCHHQCEFDIWQIGPTLQKIPAYLKFLLFFQVIVNAMIIINTIILAGNIINTIIIAIIFINTFIIKIFIIISSQQIVIIYVTAIITISIILIITATIIIILAIIIFNDHQAFHPLTTTGLAPLVILSLLNYKVTILYIIS